MGNSMCCCKNNNDKSLVECNINNNNINIKCCDRVEKVKRSLKRKFSRQRLNDDDNK